MKLELRHLSGSRAGEEQSFEDTSEVTVGRQPANVIQFDPERDRAVSGYHASIVFEQGRWILRDLGSSNGTFIGDAAVKERVLRDGDIIQFGAQGPKVRVSVASEQDLGMRPAPAADLTGPPLVAEGRTVMMMMPPSDSAPAGGAPGMGAPRKKKKGGMGRALLIVGVIGVVLVVGLVAVLFMVRSANLKKHGQASTTAQTAAPTETAPAPQSDTAAVATSEMSDTELLQKQIAEKQENLQRAQETIEKTDPNQAKASETEDLKRQIAESQALIEQMTRQLQEKNDEVATARARSAAKPKVVYVPAPSSPSQGQSAATTPVAPQGSASTQPPPASSAATRGTIPAPTSPAAQRGTTPPATTAQTAPSPAVPETPLYKVKTLKLKVTVTPVPPEIPPAGLPSSTDKGLVSLINAALVSTGQYVVGNGGQASVTVMVTNYKAVVMKSVDTQKASTSARKLGKLFGQNVPTNPVDVKSASYDAAMSVRVRMIDRAGRVLLETAPSAASQDRKTKTALAGVSFNDVALSDTAVGDVARKVVADAVDSLRAGLASLDWSTPVMASSKDKLTLGVGASARIEPGDVFEIVDADQRQLIRVRVTRVTETASECAYLSTPGKQKLTGLTARYLGGESSTAPARGERTITTNAKTAVFSGPGNSFQQVKELKSGVRMKLEYTVGAWGKVSDSSGAVWVPLAYVTIGS